MMMLFLPLLLLFFISLLIMRFSEKQEMEAETWTFNGS
jgi:Sec-independent protein secretion pathway component TatC